MKNTPARGSPNAPTSTPARAGPRNAPPVKTAVHAVGQHSTEERQEDHGQGEGAEDGSEGKRRPGHLVDEPSLGGARHPGAGVGDEQAEEEEGEILVPQYGRGKAPRRWAGEVE